MPEYVMLMKLTEQGAREIEAAPERIRLAEKMWSDLGGTMKSFHVTMGEYDYVAIGEAPSDWSALAFAATLGRTGMVQTQTLKAFSADDLQWAIDAPDEWVREAEREKKPHPPTATRKPFGGH